MYLRKCIFMDWLNIGSPIILLQNLNAPRKGQLLSYIVNEIKQPLIHFVSLFVVFFLPFFYIDTFIAALMLYLSSLT